MKKLFIAIVFCLILFTASALLAQGTVQVYFLDVGQGDANLIVASSGEVVLIDSGPSENIILAHLERLGITRIDLLIASHPHADHITGMETIIERYRPRAYIDPGIPHTTRTYERVLEAVKTQGIQYYEASERNINLGLLRFSILPPVDPLIRSSELNNNSAVIRLDYEGFSVLFTGDIERERESVLVSSVPDRLDVDVLKVSHHGSSSSSTPAFMTAASPVIAVISCGAGNQYGHPHQEVVQALQERGIEMYRTDIHGTVVVESDGRTHTVSLERESIRGPPAEPPQALADPTPQAGNGNIYVASRRSEVFHHDWCSHVDQIKPDNLISFSSREEAVQSGRRPCRSCNP